jgi:hypothetical protein
MAEPFIPDDVVRFVLDKIESVAQLEGLLLLRRDSRQEWSLEALAARLYISEGQTAELVSGLTAQGLAVETAMSPSTYRYQPKSPELAEMVDRLADIYAKQLVAMTHLIHSKQKPRVQAFADAFRLRKDD